MDSGVDERKSPKGFRIRVLLDSLRFTIMTPGGFPELIHGSIDPIPAPRVVFLGSQFELGHFPLGDLTFVNAKDGKMIIPYQYGGSTDMKTILIPADSQADMLPVIIYNFKNTKDITTQSVIMGLSKHIVVDETLPKNEMVGIKVRYPLTNVYIQKKKL